MALVTFGWGKIGWLTTSKFTGLHSYCSFFDCSVVLARPGISLLLVDRRKTTSYVVGFEN